MSTLDRRPTTHPPLVAGQRLDRATFHERYEAMPPGIKAELIGGVVHMPSPVHSSHGRMSALIALWLGNYVTETPGLDTGGDATTFLNDDSVPQPDAHLRITSGRGGQTHLENDYIVGAPEFVAEVSGSTRWVDLGPKRQAYERAGVLEYMVVSPEPAEVHWHVRRGDQFERVEPDADGIHRSSAFPGLWLDPTALLGIDRPGLKAVLERGLASREHAEFARRLAGGRGEP